MRLIRLDFDDVLNNLQDYWFQVHYDATGERIKADGWNVHEYSEHGKAIYDYFYDDDFFYNAPVKKGAKKLIKYLNNNDYYKFIIVSSCQDENEDYREYILQQKIKWLDDKFFGEVPFDRFELTGTSKRKYKADIYVDDNIDHLLDVQNKSSFRILMRTPSNKSIDVDKLSKENNINITSCNDCNELVSILKEYQ